MRPSYDGEHPVAPTPTPIYDELYSEYRRLFRALPGDRAGEEDMRFTGFAVRDRPYAGAMDEYRERQHGGRAQVQYGGEQPALPQHQAFPTHVGQLPGVPQFVPAQQQAPQHQGAQHQASQHQSSQHQSSQQHYPAAQGQLQYQQQHESHAHQPQSQPQAQGHQQYHQQHSAHETAAQPSSGQGWVAAGYLAPVSVPAPSPAVPAPAPAPGGSAAGRHRGGLLSLPPGRA